MFERLLADLFRRITDRSFLLTVTLIILARVFDMTPEEIVSYVAIIAPFVGFEKIKDWKALMSQAERVKMPESITAPGDVTVQSTPQVGAPSSSGELPDPIPVAEVGEDDDVSDELLASNAG